LLIKTLSSCKNGHDFGRAIKVLNDGFILVAGQTYNGTNYDIVVAKFTSAGELDSSFGGDINPVDQSPDGFFVYSFSASSNEDISAIAVGSDGSIYVTGHTDVSGNNDMYAMKLSAGGSLDASFNSTGIMTYDNSAKVEKAFALNLDSSNNLIIGGFSDGYPTLWKVKSNGSLDTSFSFGGVEQFSSLRGEIKSIQFDKNENIIAAGHFLIDVSIRYNMAIWKYRPDGNIDTSFGDDHDDNGVKDGYLHHHSAGGTSNGEDFGRSLLIDDHDNIIVCGDSESSHSHDPDMAIWRYSSDGVLDQSFGYDRNPADLKPDGFFLHHNAGGYDQTDRCRSIFLDEQGRLYASGYSVSSTQGSQMVVWKLR